MTVYELVEKVGGEIVTNEARVRKDGQYIVLGRIVGGAMEMTEEGRALAESISTKGSKEGK